MFICIYNISYGIFERINGIKGNHIKINMKKNRPKEIHNQKSIADNLSGLLEKNNLNSNQLANILGIPMMTVRRLLSGETEDPRISTLKIISDYFGVSVDVLAGDNSQNLLMPSKKIAAYLVPKISWDSLSEITNIKEVDFNAFKEWQSVSLNEQDTISKSTFALESKPSMYPRFPSGSIFIIDPEIIPADGDIVLVKIKLNNNVTLRELVIDPPVWQLLALTTNSKPIDYHENEHEIVGVNVLTLLYNNKFNG